MNRVSLKAYTFPSFNHQLSAIRLYFNTPGKNRDKREHFSSRLGFILITAACSIGLGNIWRFPYITGKYGGASFVILYVIFLVILGLPIVVMEFAVGRASQRSTALTFDILEPKGTKWHCFKHITFAGNYLLIHGQPWTSIP